MDKITIRAFRATDDPKRCREYAKQHHKVLTDLGVTAVVKPDVDWLHQVNNIVIVAEHKELGMVAGIRLDGVAPDVTCKMETCLRSLGEDISGTISELQREGTAELCGLWNAHRFAGRGVPFLLIATAVAVANQAGLNSIVTFIAEYVAGYADRAGFQPMCEIGENGDLTYPIDTIKTKAMVLPDVLTVTSAGLNDRHRIISLRTKPRQERIECTKPETQLEVKYDLVLDHSLTWQFDEVIHSLLLHAA